MISKGTATMASASRLMTMSMKRFAVPLQPPAEANIGSAQEPGVTVKPGEVSTTSLDVLLLDANI
jgi:hypothetical protein